MVTLLYLEASHMSLHFSRIWNVTWHWKPGLRVLVWCLWRDWAHVRVNEYVHGGGVRKGKEDENKEVEKEEVISRLERRQPLGFYLRDIHLVSEFIRSIYYSSVCVLAGIVVLLNSSGTCPPRNSRLRWLLIWAKTIKGNTIIWLNSQTPICRLTWPQRPT